MIMTGLLSEHGGYPLYASIVELQPYASIVELQPYASIVELQPYASIVEGVENFCEGSNQYRDRRTG